MSFSLTGIWTWTKGWAIWGWQNWGYVLGGIFLILFLILVFLQVWRGIRGNKSS